MCTSLQSKLSVSKEQYVQETKRDAQRAIAAASAPKAPAGPAASAPTAKLAAEPEPRTAKLASVEVPRKVARTGDANPAGGQEQQSGEMSGEKAETACAGDAAVEVCAAQMATTKLSAGTASGSAARGKPQAVTCMPCLGHATPG